jgi:hypothetical protein
MNKHIRGALALAAAAGLASALAACSQSAQVNGPPQVHAFDSAAINVSTLRDVARDSTVVVLAKWSGKSDNAYVGGTAYPVSTMQVIRVVKGSLTQNLVEVRVGYEDANTGHSPLDTGATYLLFLKPFWFEPGEDTGQYTTAAGPFGVFTSSRDSDTTFETVVIPDDGMSGISVAGLTDVSLTDVSQVSVSTPGALAARDRAGATS